MATKKITTVPGIPYFRAPTGPLQLGADWPGVFIRGDEALRWSKSLGLAARVLRKHAKQTQDGDLHMAAAHLRELIQLLRSSQLRGDQQRQFAEDHLRAVGH